MWRGKKPDRPLVTNPEPNDLQPNQPSKPPQATLEGTTQISKDAVCPTWSDGGERGGASWAELACEGEISTERVWKAIPGLTWQPAWFDEARLDAPDTEPTACGEKILGGQSTARPKTKPDEPQGMQQ
jgi:hypothetical protein